jgi:hypothetical protein
MPGSSSNSPNPKSKIQGVNRHSWSLEIISIFFVLNLGFVSGFEFSDLVFLCLTGGVQPKIRGGTLSFAERRGSLIGMERQVWGGLDR